MRTTTLPLGAEPDGYHSRVRVDVAPYLPVPAGRVLDIGCGSGASADLIRRAGAERLVGIELNPAAAALAAKRYDRVVVGDAQAALDELGGEAFDTFVAWDVLEHLYDPAELLARLGRMAAPAARLHISVPNARNILLVRDLVLRGTFGYAEHGHRDATHVRWFTRADIAALVEECGWRVSSITTHPFRPGRRLITQLTGGRSAEFFAVQWFLLAER